MWNLGYQLLKRMVFKFAASAKQHRIRSELLPDVDKCAPAKLDYGEIINLEQLLCYCIEHFNKSHFVLCDWSHGVCPVGQTCPAAVVWQWLMTPGSWCTTRCINTVWLITKTDFHSFWICLATLLAWWWFSVTKTNVKGNMRVFRGKQNMPEERKISCNASIFIYSVNLLHK